MSQVVTLSTTTAKQDDETPLRLELTSAEKAMQNKKDDTIRKLRSRTSVKKVSTARWKEPVSYDKSRHARRTARKLNQSEDQESKRSMRIKNHTLSHRRTRHYTEGQGQQGIGIPFTRTRRNIEYCIALALEELKDQLGPDFEYSRRYIWTDYVDTIRAALDQYTNRIIDTASAIASGRLPEQEVIDDGKKRKRPRGLKCRNSDFDQALVAIHSCSY